MRGKEKPVCCTPDQNGITPAYAGKSEEGCNEADVS